MEKKCTRCNCNFDISCFSKHDGYKDNHSCWCRQCHRDYCIERKEELKIKRKEYYRNNRDKVRLINKKWAEKNEDKMRFYKKRWAGENKDKIKELKRVRTKERLESDPMFKLTVLLRNRIRIALKGNCKKSKTKDILGCSIEELMEYLQKTAIDNGYLDFDINDYSGKEYHIDHKLPCSSFNLLNENELMMCFHYTNLQILSAYENLVKNNKIK
jgi:hypothetical protein